MSTWSYIAGGAIALAAISSPLSAAQQITGKWVTDDGRAVVHIEACGNKTLCGKVVHINRPSGGAGKPTGIVEGASILTDLVEDGDMWKGKIHNPGNGSTYMAKVNRSNDGSLSVAGCVAFLCKTLKWRPA